MNGYPRKLFLATDGTEDSARAAEAAVALAGSPGSKLHVVHVGQAASATTGATAVRPPLPGALRVKPSGRRGSCSSGRSRGYGPPAGDAPLHQVLVQFQDPGERAGGTLVPKTEFIVL